jgi:hypothetical protein
LNSKTTTTTNHAHDHSYNRRLLSYIAKIKLN